MSYLYIPLQVQAGVQRDGTHADSTYYLDSQHIRFYQGKPKKMGGYRLLTNGSPTIIRSMIQVSRSDGTLDQYYGRYNKLSYVNVTKSGIGGAEIDRTPIGFVPSENGVWSFALMTAVEEDTTYSAVIAAYLPEGLNLDSVIEGNVYIGLTDNNDPFVKLTNTDVDPEEDVMTAGGVVSVKPFLMRYGTNGVIRFSETDNPSSWPADQYLIPFNSKVLAVKPLLAGANPAALAWSSNALARLVYDPSAQNFGFSVEESVSLLAPNSIVKVNSIYFWIGNDQFYLYNGVTQKLDNSMNTDYFFDHLNEDQVSKIWGYYNNKYNEIHWFWPRRGSDEVTEEIIFNLTTKSWYDNRLARSIGMGTDIFKYPIMADANTETLDENFGNYGVWIQEIGVNQDLNGTQYAIPAWVESNYVSFTKMDPKADYQISVKRILVDFVQTETMKVSVLYRGFPSDETPETIVGPVDFDADTSKVDLGGQGMYASIRFESNTKDGNFFMGAVTLCVQKGDTRPLK